MSSFFVAVMLLAGAARAAETHVGDWNKARQPQHVGYYQGHVRDWMAKKTACEYKRANLQIQTSTRYRSTTRCERGKGKEEVVTGSWRIDEMAGSCLILMREPPLQSTTSAGTAFGSKATQSSCVRTAGNAPLQTNATMA
jgi:hypothetical protein